MKSNTCLCLFFSSNELFHLHKTRRDRLSWMSWVLSHRMCRIWNSQQSCSHSRYRSSRKVVRCAQKRKWSYSSRPSNSTKRCCIRWFRWINHWFSSIQHPLLGHLLLGNKRMMNISCILARDCQYLGMPMNMIRMRKLSINSKLMNQMSRTWRSPLECMLWIRFAGLDDM